MTDAIDVLSPREVPLGGVRSMTVRRTLPHRDRTLIGPWCFVDHYGPSAASMDVAPHPHCGLQTVTWLFEGEVEHRDSAGNVQTIRPGEVNLMTSGAGICHSEVSTTTGLHGVQLWIALPDTTRSAGRGFDHFGAESVVIPDSNSMATARVFIGSLAGAHSPVTVHTPSVGAEIRLAAYSSIDLPVTPDFEHAVLLDSGSVSVDGVALGHGDLACIDPGTTSLRLASGSEGARILLIGGEPLREDIVMWWNFVARDHDEIVAARTAWEAQSDRFGAVTGYAGPVDRLPAPAMPQVHLKPRKARRSGS